MAGPSPPYRLAPGRRPKLSLLAWVAIVCVIAVVAEIGVVTDGFGIGGLLGKGGSHGGSTPFNPNPGNETITGVTGTIVYNGGGSGNFPQFAGGSLCPRCPILPTTLDSVSPPISGVWVYVNITFTGAKSQSISNFTLTTSGANPALFTLIGVYLYPGYSEAATKIVFTPGSGSTIGVGIFAEATSIPEDGSAGYALTFGVTSP